jgi:predicted TIM-barrel fold metal-dependent hydrolase
MFIVDSQIHVWGANTPERPWPARAEAQKPYPVTAEMVLTEMDANGVDRVIIVPPSWEGDRNDLGLAAARARPDRFAVVGRLDVEAPGGREQIAGWMKQPGMLGLRFTYHIPVLQEPLLQGRIDWVWAELEKAGVPLYILCPHSHVHLFDRIAQRHPGLRIVMDHLGLNSHFKDEACFRDLDRLLALSKHPNVAVKSTALPCYTTDTYPFRKVHGHLRRVYDAFGPKRMFWGTDWTRLPCPYGECIDLFTKELPWLSGEDKEWIMGRGVCEWLGWKI